MRRIGAIAVALLGLGLMTPGCGDDDGTDGTGDVDAGPGGGMDGGDGGGGGTDGGDGGGTAEMDGGDGGGHVVEIDGGFLLPDGAVVECLPAMCQGTLYACGNCMDDDDDGLTDSEDPDCLGPCDNNEAGFNLMIPGSPLSPCSRDCYFDNNSGSGNDDCDYDLRCDPLSPGTRPSNPSCPADGRTCEDDPSPTCLSLCGPLVPNGCDCYGCCDITATDGTVHTVYLGSVPAAGQPACSIETVGNPEACRPCTQTTECFNDCGRCELCIGRTVEDLPADCFPPPPVDGGGTPIDAGPPVDGGTPTPRCDDGRQACGLPGDPACPAGYYCLTGCCVFFG